MERKAAGGSRSQPRSPSGRKRGRAGRSGSRLASEELETSCGGVENQDAEDALTLRVEGTINGETCLMTVDTGAERTIVHLDVVGGEELGDNLRQLCGVTGYCMPLWGPINITIGLGGKQVNWPVYVSEVQDKCLLGLDLLRAVGALIDLKRGILTVCGEEVPLLYTEDLAEVVVTREVMLPPCSETRVECHLSRVMKGSTGMVEAAEVAEDVMVARGVIPRNKIRVLMANFSEEQRTIHAGTKVGVCEEISGEVEIIEERQEGGQRGGQRMAAPGRSVPAHLVDLARRSMKCLSADQRGKMQEMLCCYADVFSKDDLDLGKTDLVKHHIDTGDAVPIKHAPRGIPPLKRAEITAEVRKLHRQGHRTVRKSLVLSGGISEKARWRSSPLCWLSSSERCDYKRFIPFTQN